MNDRGSATIWVAGAIAALLGLVVLVCGVGAAVLTRHRAAAAADLAALAAATSTTAGEQYACSRARWVADRMNVVLASCRLDGWDALVEVTASPPGPLAGFGTASAHARAGPAEA